MPADSFRFVHATNLRLDQPLTGAGSLSPDDRAIVEDATLTALTRVVDACIEHNADFLLLTGDCFEFQNGTLRGRLQMQRGLERLAEHDVAVFIIPGSLDPPASWKRGLTLPKNTTLFTSEEDDPVTLTIADRFVVSVAPVAMATSDESNWGASGPAVWRSSEKAYRVGLVGAGSAIRWEGSSPEPSGGRGTSSAAATLVRNAIEHGVNYLALGEGAVRQTIDIADGIAHDPGSPQGLNLRESGAKGCSLVEVDADGDVDVTFISTAAVRWMSLAVDAPAQVSLEQLAEQMALVAMESEPYPSDDLWLIRWNVRGSAEWTQTLASSRSQADLWEKVERELASIGGPSRRHTIDTTARPTAERKIVREPGRRDIVEEFCEGIDADAEAALEMVRQEILGADWGQAAWSRHVRQALQRVRISDVSRRTRELGESWLS
jgi:DNA repair exonuclease SbcCD nuclease subunit